HIGAAGAAQQLIDALHGAKTFQLVAHQCPPGRKGLASGAPHGDQDLIAPVQLARQVREERLSSVGEQRLVAAHATAFSAGQDAGRDPRHKRPSPPEKTGRAPLSARARSTVSYSYSGKRFVSAATR